MVLYLEQLTSHLIAHNSEHYYSAESFSLSSLNRKNILTGPVEKYQYFDPNQTLNTKKLFCLGF